MGIEHLNYLATIFSKIVSKFWGKLILSVSLIPVFFFDPLLKDGLIALLALTIIDFISGVIAAKKTKEQIKSAKIFNTVIKISVYFTLIAAGHLTMKAGFHFLPIEGIILTFLAVTELVSLIENFGKLGYAVPKKLLNQLKNFENK